MKEEKETPGNKKNVKAITIGGLPLFIFLILKKQHKLKEDIK